MEEAIRPYLCHRQHIQAHDRSLHSVPVSVTGFFLLFLATIQQASPPLWPEADGTINTPAQSRPTLLLRQSSAGFGTHTNPEARANARASARASARDRVTDRHRATTRSPCSRQDPLRRVCGTGLGRRGCLDIRGPVHRASPTRGRRPRRRGRRHDLRPCSHGRGPEDGGRTGQLVEP